MSKVIITIGRQYGSGGREIGRRLAKALDIPFYDKELIAMAAEEGGVDPRLIENLDEKGSSRFFYALPVTNFTPSSMIGGGIEMSMNDRLFLLQSKVIKRIADEGSCVIVGRCGDYVLNNNPNVAHIFIHASKALRVKRVTELYGVSDSDVESKITKIDKARANYYNYYSGKKWGAVENYTISINSGIGIDETVEVLKKLIEVKFK